MLAPVVLMNMALCTYLMTESVSGCCFCCKIGSLSFSYSVTSCWQDSSMFLW